MHKKPALFFVLFFFLGTTSGLSQKSANVDTLSKEQQLMNPLFGTWAIDLRPSPTDSLYLKEFTFTSYEEGKLKGFFYGAPFSNGRVNLAWGKFILLLQQLITPERTSIVGTWRMANCTAPLFLPPVALCHLGSAPKRNNKA